MKSFFEHMLKSSFNVNCEDELCSKTDKKNPTIFLINSPKSLETNQESVPVLVLKPYRGTNPLNRISLKDASLT